MSKIQGIRRRTWAEIDLDNVKQNFQAIRATVGKDVKI